MFGDKLIIGHSEGLISDKGRIFPPSFTNPESGDQILIQKTTWNNEPALKIFAYNEYLKIIERYQKLRENATTFEEEEKYNKIIEKICYTLESLAQIDKQKRINLPNHLLKEYGWKTKDEIVYTGLGESLLITKK